MTRWRVTCLLCVMLLVGCAEPAAQLDADADVAADRSELTNAAFPLALSINQRYLTDWAGTPFLIKEISAWGLIQSMSELEAGEFMLNVRLRGFNTLLVSVISNDQRFAGQPPSWQGIDPFRTRWDFSTANAAYFDHVDRVLAMARDRGLLVLLVPCYLGYPGDPTQGWSDQLLDAANSVDKSREYGRFLGRRYRDFSNIVWVAGGDNSATGELQPHMRSIIEGIREFDAHLWTGHFDASSGDIFSTDNRAFSDVIALDGLYAWTEAELGARGPQYKLELERYALGKPIFQLDQSYEQDVPRFADNLDPQWIRRKNYGGLLSGCAGTSFSPGTRDNQLYTFKSWRPLMSTQGMAEARIAFNLFESRAWQRLVPDTDNRLVIAGRGSFGDKDYACAARSGDGDTALVYVPSGRTLTLDLRRISGKTALAWWFDPQTGVADQIAYYPTNGPQTFATPSDSDWVLVVDDATKSFLPPGIKPRR